MSALLLESRIGDCGCPEEVYDFKGIDLIIHFEPPSDRAPPQVDAFMDGGDWGEAETTVFSADREAARHSIFAWAERLTVGVPA